MRKLSWICLLALVWGLAASAAQALDGMSAGPLPRGTQNVLGKFACLVFVGEDGPDSLTIEIQTAPPGGGTATPFATHSFTGVDAGEIKELTVTGVPPFRQVICIIDDTQVSASLSALTWHNDSIETVIGVSGNTAPIGIGAGD